MQTLTTFDLRFSDINEIGAQHLANALRQNKVTGLFVSLCPQQAASFAQTLTTLELRGNRIGDEGVQHLVDALRQNKVHSPLFSLSSSTRLFHVDTHYTQSRSESDR